MADIILHFAVGVFVASRFGFERLPRYLVGAAAVLPDLDALFERFILWRGAAWFGWSGSETLDALRLAGHGGILHSVLAVVVVALLASLFSMRWKVGAAAGVAWLSHMLLDVFATGGGTLLWWPFSTEVVSNPLIVAYEPVLLVLSTFFLIGTGMGDLYLYDRKKEFGPRTRLILRKFGPRLAKGAAQMAGFVLLFLLVSKTVLVSGHSLEGADVVAIGVPEFHIYEGADGGYEVTVWGAFGEAKQKTFVPFVSPDVDGARRPLALQGLCVARALEDILVLHHPVVIDADPFVVIAPGGATLEEPGSGPREALVLHPTQRGDGFGAAWTADLDDLRERDRTIPISVVAATGC